MFFVFLEKIFFFRWRRLVAVISPEVNHVITVGYFIFHIMSEAFTFSLIVSIPSVDFSGASPKL